MVKNYVIWLLFVGLAAAHFQSRVSARSTVESVTLTKVAQGNSTITEISGSGVPGDARLFFAEQAGVIRIVSGAGATLPTPFLDIGAKVLNAGERGLLGLAFHPDHESNGLFYVNYIDRSGDTVIARFGVSANPNVADAASELQILKIAQPFSNHNSGPLHFGPNGYLYITTGDGGWFDDPNEVAQNGESLLGKMLRIDVDSGSPYGIPPTNPFTDTVGVRNEIWALGLRNPWRFDFDELTGDLWLADVGQWTWEEINFQPATSSGGENYGWDCYEATHPYETTGCAGAGNYTMPIYEYQHSFGRCSVTGGIVYRGSDNPSMFGSYFFGDYCSGELWALGGDPTDPVVTPLDVDGGDASPTVFGSDNDRELYVGYALQNNSGGGVYRIDEPLPDAVTLAQFGVDKAPTYMGLLAALALLSAYALVKRRSGH